MILKAIEVEGVIPDRIRRAAGDALVDQERFDAFAELHRSPGREVISFGS
jgi:hypothetical protein